MADVTAARCFVDWAPHCSRSEALARALGMALVRHHRPRRGLRSLPAKYAAQLVATLWDLARVRPRVLACMSPSPLTALPVWIYGRLTGAPFVIDAHTGAFVGRPWDRMPALQRFFCRQAALTLVTNDMLRRRVESWGGRAMLVPDVPTEAHAPVPATRGPELTAVFVASFGLDEPIEVVVEAARQCPEVTVVVTGRPRGPGARALASAPPNVRPVGFVDRSTYLGLVASADVVIALTTRDHTMQRAAYEAIYLGTPVIVSDWPLLRENFERGGLVCANEPEALAAALRRADGRRAALREGAQGLCRDKLRRWARVHRELEHELTVLESSEGSTRARRPA